MIEEIQKAREYLDYLEEHYNNVLTAWLKLQDVCKDMRFIYDDFVYTSIGLAVVEHDKSKLSKDEFIPYCNKFFPTKDIVQNEKEFNHAWNHHTSNNRHHWQNWTTTTLQYYDWEIAIVHMILDWMAMGYKFNDTAQSYYEKHKDEMNIHKNAEKFMYEIFKRLAD